MKKNLICFLMFCMFINFLVPKFSIEPDDYNTLSQLIERQSTLLYFFSLSTLPMKMVNELFIKQTAQPLKPVKSSDKPSSPCKNTSSDYSLLSPSNLNIIKNEFTRTWLPYVNTLYLRTIFDRPLYKYFGTAPGDGMIFLCVLIFFFLRPRSSIEDALFFSYKIIKARL